MLLCLAIALRRTRPAVCCASLFFWPQLLHKGPSKHLNIQKGLSMQSICAPPRCAVLISSLMSIQALPDTAKPVTITWEKHIVLLVKIRSLPHCMQDGTSKMSKSAESDFSRINLLDDPKTIQNKIKRAKTDAGEGLEWGNPDRPEATNLLGIYSLCTGMSMVCFLGNRSLHHCKPHCKRYKVVWRSFKVVELKQIRTGICC